MVFWERGCGLIVEATGRLFGVAGPAPQRLRRDTPCRFSSTAGRDEWRCKRHRPRRRRWSWPGVTRQGSGVLGQVEPGSGRAPVKVVP